MRATPRGSPACRPWLRVRRRWQVECALRADPARRYELERLEQHGRRARVLAVAETLDERLYALERRAAHGVGDAVAVEGRKRLNLPQLRPPWFARRPRLAFQLRDDLAEALVQRL